MAVPEGAYVLGIAGSPRRHGNSERLLDSFLAGVVDSGRETFKLVASEAGISACLGCNACSSTGECVRRDGMTDVYPLLDGAAAIVVATPVFFATVPSSLKALYDRCQPYWVRRYLLGAPRGERRPGAVLVVRGGGDPYGYECAVTTTRSVFAVLGVDAGDPLVVEGVDTPGEIEERRADLDRARAMGRALASGL